MSTRILFLAPLAMDVGLTSVALGVVRALQRDGIKVGFVKPISQPDVTGRSKSSSGGETSSHFARTLCFVHSPESIAFEKAVELVAKGEMDSLLEEVVNMVEAMKADHDAVIVEGLIPLAAAQLAQRLNVEIARSLGADVIPVLSGAEYDPKALAETVTLARQQYLQETKRRFPGIIINKMPSEGNTEAVKAALKISDGIDCEILSAIPYASTLNAPRLSDIVSSLDLKVVQGSGLDQIRVQEIVVAARTVENIIRRLRPGTLVVTPGERSDIALAAALANERGVPLAGMLLSCGSLLADQVAELITSPGKNAMPILSSPDDTYVTASRLSHLSYHVSRDDSVHMERVIAFIADHMDTSVLRQRIGEPTELRMSPPSFRHRLIQLAHAANRRIVLPEGNEPRTIQAAITCQQKGIAHCVLLGDRAEIESLARAQQLELPADLEIIDPEAVRARYIPTMVELRKSKGLTAPQAAAQLEDNVVLGTVMLALGEVDGLVSGAVHTTANTIRPALQLIKTKPGESIVSSVFFMLMPDQVLVYGDCAVNPNPTAEQLADIAVQSADTAKAFGLDPRVAMISYSTGTSGSGDDVEKVRAATEMAKAKRPDVLIDGPMQYDAASVESVARSKAPGSPVAGRANVFIFPDLNTGNTTYKAVQRSAHVVSVGPMLQGLRKPVNDLSRGALVDDIVFTIALTAIQSQQTEPEKAASLIAAE
ncbi:phosphate acetyltransferase [Consotaella salsifontis]|uniref:Phosphate acetyltransferase n=1 Tax=Consotaella salsifontis TaxID=1365950 RepID=A0A1T4LE41_9HYPH|nr:phosphate acetyltransferase [Consotaella salsifontis]SJZ53015.1 phosphotransacetylase [Consotaella salsifontis]